MKYTSVSTALLILVTLSLSACGESKKSSTKKEVTTPPSELVEKETTNTRTATGTATLTLTGPSTETKTLTLTLTRTATETRVSTATQTTPTTPTITLTLTGTVTTVTPPAVSTELTIHAAEFGIGKFHRKDNEVHPYADNNVWKVFIPDSKAPFDGKNMVRQKNKDNSYTVFYSNLDELFTEMEKISDENNHAKIKVFNLHAHGSPGGMGFPRDVANRDSSACIDWKDKARGDDLSNYNQYYGIGSENQIGTTDEASIDYIASLTNTAFYSQRDICVTDLSDWKLIAARHPKLKAAFADDVQIHFLSCANLLRHDEFS